MSARRRLPSSLLLLGGLIVLSIVAALAAGVVLYLQSNAQARRTAEGITGGNYDAGKVALAHYGCGGCHSIPGVSGAAGQVGPALKGVAVRAHLAGKLPNEPQSMVRWLEHPQQVSPGSGMPEMGVTHSDARDMAAYLYTLK